MSSRKAELRLTHFVADLQVTEGWLMALAELQRLQLSNGQNDTIRRAVSLAKDFAAIMKDQNLVLISRNKETGVEKIIQYVIT